MAQTSEEGEKRYEQWAEKVYKINGKTAEGSGVLIDQNMIVTAGHLGFNLNENYMVTNTSRYHMATCTFICKRLDFAVLYSSELPTTTFTHDVLSSGKEYYLIGYPGNSDHAQPSITRGIIECLWSDRVHLIGTPGARRGFSGGAVLNKLGFLCGILIGGINLLTPKDTVQEIFENIAEQKNVRILPIGYIANECSQGPSHSDSES